jgi:hypothetical protein
VANGSLIHGVSVLIFPCGVSAVERSTPTLKTRPVVISKVATILSLVAQTLGSDLCSPGQNSFKPLKNHSIQTAMTTRHPTALA